MKVKHRSFSGGYKFSNYEGRPTNNIVELEIPSKVIIPLRQGFGGEVTAIVKPGDNVKAGQVIGIDDNTVSSPVHSSVNGVVEEIKKINYFNREVSAVVIKSDGTKEWQPLDGHSSNWSELSSEKIQELLYKSGVASLDRSGIPTKFKTSVILPEEVENVIVHGTGTEPFNPSLDALLEDENKSNFVEGLKILKTVMPNAKFHVALNEDNQEMIEENSKLLSDLDGVELYSMSSKYPQDYDEMLVPTILDKKYPYGYSAANIGVVVLNIQTILHTFEAVTLGKSLLERTIALGGPSWKENNHVVVRVGTPLEDVVSNFIKEDGEHRVMMNSLLTGPKLSNNSMPVDRTYFMLVAIPENRSREVFNWLRLGKHRDSFSNTFLASLMPKALRKAETNVHGEPRPCINCGYCEKACPVNLMPHLLYKHVERGMMDERVTNYGIFNCIDCNLCSFVCPSKIDVSRHIKEGKENLINDGCSYDNCILPYFDLRGLEEYKGIK